MVADFVRVGMLPKTLNVSFQTEHGDEMSSREERLTR
jgi:hypothetical protein